MHHVGVDKRPGVYVAHRVLPGSAGSPTVWREVADAPVLHMSAPESIQT